MDETAATNMISCSSNLSFLLDNPGIASRYAAEMEAINKAVKEPSSSEDGAGKKRKKSRLLCDMEVVEQPVLENESIMMVESLVCALEECSSAVAIEVQVQKLLEKALWCPELKASGKLELNLYLQLKVAC